MLGDVKFEAAGQGYTLVLSANALCEVEAQTGMGVSELGDQLKTPTLTLMRTLFWAGLQDHHEGLTVKEAGRIMSELGLAKAGEIVGRAVAAAFPADKGGGGSAAGPRRKAGAGTGTKSSRTS